MKYPYSIKNISSLGEHIWGKNAKVFGYDCDGDILCHNWIIFDNCGIICWYVKHDPSADIIVKAREATMTDWTYISPNNSEGFFDEDFRGCVFKGFDITGTMFTNCIFDENFKKDVFCYNKAIFKKCSFTSESNYEIP